VRRFFLRLPDRVNQNVARGAATRKHLLAVATALFAARSDSPDAATLASTGAIDKVLSRLLASPG
jgi:hypothetical protein